MLLRDRLVVAGAIVALAWGYVLWFAADMDMGGMDMTGFRMIPRRHGNYGAGERARESYRVRVRVRHVGSDYGRILI